MALLAKTKINTIKILVSKALSDSYINHDEFVSMNKKMKEEIKTNLKALWNILDKNNGNLLCHL